MIVIQREKLSNARIVFSIPKESIFHHYLLPPSCPADHGQDQQPYFHRWSVFGEVGTRSINTINTQDATAKIEVGARSATVPTTT